MEKYGNGVLFPIPITTFTVSGCIGLCSIHDCFQVSALKWRANICYLFVSAFIGIFFNSLSTCWFTGEVSWFLLATIYSALLDWKFVFHRCLFPNLSLSLVLLIVKFAQPGIFFWLILFISTCHTCKQKVNSCRLNKKGTDQAQIATKLNGCAA